LTILGELVAPSGTPAWSAALLYVLNGLGVERCAARQALARAAAADWIVSEKLGRSARWRLAETGFTLIEEIAQRLMSLAAVRKGWEGNWLIVYLSIPRNRPSIRKRLYNELRWQGFGTPVAGLWVNPYVARAEQLKKIIEEFELRDLAIVFVGSTTSVGLADEEIVRQAWGLDDVATRYEKLIEVFDGLDPGPGDEVLFTYLALVNQWCRFPAIDPHLPGELLPTDWIGRSATDMFNDLRHRWRDAAYQRWQEITETAAPDV
jgi:phenylacetic acid degradation operon negative regulatory protein